MAGRSGQLPRAAKRIERVWSHVLRLIPGWESASIAPSPSHLRGVTDVLPWCDLNGWTGVDPEIVKIANSKITSHRIEKDLGFAPAGSQIVSDLAQLERACRNVEGRWVAKHPFGVAGRERVLGRGEPGGSQAAWCQKMFEQGWSLVFEPWIEDAREFSTHWDIGSEVTWVGACEVLTHADGTFAGVRPGVEPAPEIARQARLAATEIHGLGYRGPLGLDGIVGTLGDQHCVRGIMEINARWTFGRLGLYLRDRACTPIVWHHTDATSALVEWDDLDQSGAAMLPEWADPGGQSGSWVRMLARD